MSSTRNFENHLAQTSDKKNSSNFKHLNKKITNNYKSKKLDFIDQKNTFKFSVSSEVNIHLKNKNKEAKKLHQTKRNNLSILNEYNFDNKKSSNSLSIERITLNNKVLSNNKLENNSLNLFSIDYKSLKSKFKCNTKDNKSYNIISGKNKISKKIIKKSYCLNHSFPKYNNLNLNNKKIKLEDSELDIYLSLIKCIGSDTVNYKDKELFIKNNSSKNALDKNTLNLCIESNNNNWKKAIYIANNPNKNNKSKKNVLDLHKVSSGYSSYFKMEKQSSIYLTSNITNNLEIKNKENIKESSKEMTSFKYFNKEKNMPAAKNKKRVKCLALKNIESKSNETSFSFNNYNYSSKEIESLLSKKKAKELINKASNFSVNDNLNSIESKENNENECNYFVNECYFSNLKSSNSNSDSGNRNTTKQAAIEYKINTEANFEVVNNVIMDLKTKYCSNSSDKIKNNISNTDNSSKLTDNNYEITNIAKITNKNKLNNKLLSCINCKNNSSSESNDYESSVNNIEKNKDYKNKKNTITLTSQSKGNLDHNNVKLNTSISYDLNYNVNNNKHNKNNGNSSYFSKEEKEAVCNIDSLKALSLSNKKTIYIEDFRKAIDNKNLVVVLQSFEGSSYIQKLMLKNIDKDLINYIYNICVNNLIILLNHPLSNYFIQLFYHKLDIEKQYNFMLVILNNNNIILKRTLSLNALISILENPLDDTIQKLVCNFYKNVFLNTINIFNNYKLLRILEALLISCKEIYIDFIINFILNDISNLLNSRSGLFLVRKFCKIIKNENIQHLFVQKISLNYKNLVNSMNGSIICQCVIRNFIIKESPFKVILNYFSLENLYKINIKKMSTSRMEFNDDHNNSREIDVCIEIANSIKNNNKNNNIFANPTIIKNKQNTEYKINNNNNSYNILSHEEVYNELYKNEKIFDANNKALKFFFKSFVDCILNQINNESEILNVNLFKLLLSAIKNGGEYFHNLLVQALIDNRSLMYIMFLNSINIQNKCLHEMSNNLLLLLIENVNNKLKCSIINELNKLKFSISENYIHYYKEIVLKLDKLIIKYAYNNNKNNNFFNNNLNLYSVSNNNNNSNNNLYPISNYINCNNNFVNNFNTNCNNNINNNIYENNCYPNLNINVNNYPSNSYNKFPSHNHHVYSNNNATNNINNFNYRIHPNYNINNLIENNTINSSSNINISNKDISNPNICLNYKNININQTNNNLNYHYNNNNFFNENTFNMINAINNNNNNIPEYNNTKFFNYNNNINLASNSTANNNQQQFLFNNINQNNLNKMLHNYQNNSNKFINFTKNDNVNNLYK